MKPATFMSLILLAVLVFTVFHVERRVQGMRGELEEVNRQLISDKSEIHTLQAEWAYLNRPQRLRDIAGNRLSLNYIVPAQVRSIDDIALRPVLVGSNSGY